MSNKELTVKQETFLNNLIETKGDVNLSARLAGYADGSLHYLTQSMQKEILDYTNGVLIKAAPKAAHALVDMMESDKPILQAALKKDTAKEVLDRTGIVKREKIDINNNVQGGLFILPAKGLTRDDET